MFLTIWVTPVKKVVEIACIERQLPRWHAPLSFRTTRIGIRGRAGPSLAVAGASDGLLQRALYEFQAALGALAKLLAGLLEAAFALGVQFVGDGQGGEH